MNYIRENLDQIKSERELLERERKIKEEKEKNIKTSNIDKLETMSMGKTLIENQKSTKKENILDS